MTGSEVGAAALANDPGRRGSLLRVFRAALAAVDAERAVVAALERRGDVLTVGERAIDLRAVQRVVVLAFGKAAVPMARGAVSVLGDRRPEGVVVTNDPAPVEGLTVVPASHPVPDAASVAAARRLVEAGSSGGPGDLVVVAISGGGSALLTLPAGGLSLEAVADTTACLLRSGASIQELNAVRKHLSAVKGGRLAETVAGASEVVTLVISDVVGDSLEVIASGPMVPDGSTFGDALAVLDRFELRDQVPPAVFDHLAAGAEGLVPETPGPGPLFDRQTVMLIASAEAAARGAAEEGRRLGWEAAVVSTTLTGEAREVAADLARVARDLSPGELLVYAGETTVTVTGDGIGGRNQELALAAALELAGDEGVVLLSAGTDGIDGMSDAAGAFADGGTVGRGRDIGLGAAEFLARNDSYSYLSAVGDVLVTGPTGTNVGDVILVARSG